MTPAPGVLPAIGDPVSAVETPALVVDADVLEANIARMSAYAGAAGIRLRPHGKTHKCSAIGRLQVAAGAVGLCCQKTAEAEAFVAGGITDVLVTNEVLAPAKLRRLARLAGLARIGVCIDSSLGLSRLAAASADAPAPIDAYLELEVGAGRCGIVGIDDAVMLAEKIVATPGLRFGGIHAYQGAAQHLRSVAARGEAIGHAIARAAELVAALGRRGIDVPVVTGAGTGTFPHEASSGVYGEIQPGSYVFMDRDYGDNETDPAVPAFGNSLFVLAGTISRRGDYAVIDAGLKAHSVDSGFPAIAGRPDLSFERPSDEHGIIRTSGGPLPGLDERVWLIPGHCDPTVNLHDRIIVIRGGVVAAIWEVDARGALA